MGTSLEVVFKIKRKELDENILNKVNKKLNQEFTKTEVKFVYNHPTGSKRKYIKILQNDIQTGGISKFDAYIPKPPYNTQQHRKDFIFLNMWPITTSSLYEKDEFYFPPEDFTKIAKIVFEESKAVGAWGGFDEHLEKYNWEFEDCIEWINFFGEELVKKYGKEKLLSAPAYKVEELPNKGIFIWSSYLFGTFGFPSKKEIKEKNLTEEDLDFYDEWEQERKIAKHLGIKLKGAKGVELKP